MRKIYIAARFCTCTVSRSHFFSITFFSIHIQCCIPSFELESFIFLKKKKIFIRNYYCFSIDDATVLLEKEREFLDDPKSFKVGAGIKRDEGTSQRIQRVSSVKVIANFSPLQ